MHLTIASIQNLLAYARFPNPELRQEADSYLKTLGADLVDAEYESGEETDLARESLENKMSEIDSASDELVEALENADEEDIEEDDDISEEMARKTTEADT